MLLPAADGVVASFVVGQTAATVAFGSGVVFVDDDAQLAGDGTTWDTALRSLQDALDAELVVHRAHPLNCETSISALLGGVVMPNAHFYVRNHFQIPNLDPDALRLSVGSRDA